MMTLKNILKFITMVLVLLPLIACGNETKSSANEQLPKTDIFSEFIDIKSDNYKDYFDRGKAIYQKADKWKTIERFEESFPINANQLAHLFYLIEQGKVPLEIQAYSEFEDLKCFYFSFKEFGFNFEKAASLNKLESEKLYKDFYLENPILSKMMLAFFGEEEK